MAEILRLPGAASAPVTQQRTRGGKLPKGVSYLPEVRRVRVKSNATQVNDSTRFGFASMAVIEPELLARLSALPHAEKCFASGYLNAAITKVLGLLRSKEVPHG